MDHCLEVGERNQDCIDEHEESQQENREREVNYMTSYFIDSLDSSSILDAHKERQEEETEPSKEEWKDAEGSIDIIVLEFWHLLDYLSPEETCADF